MAETPQANEGDAAKDEITSADQTAAESQDSAAAGEGTVEVAAGPEAAVAAGNADAEAASEPIGAAGDQTTSEPEPAPAPAPAPAEAPAVAGAAPEPAADPVPAEAPAAAEPAQAESAADPAPESPPAPAPAEAPAVAGAAPEPAADPVPAEAPAAAEPVQAEPAADPAPESPPAPAPAEAAAAAEPAQAESAAAASEDFAQMLDAEGAPEAGAGSDIKTGDKVSGVIVKVEGENSFVDYGGRGEAVIRTSELKDPKGEMLFKVGDPVEAFVVTTGDEVQVSRGLSRQDAQADVLYQAFKAGMPVEGRIDAVNKWGLGVTIEGDVRGFCPISQVDTKFVENAEDYRGKKLAFKIIEFRHQGRDIVVSRRALLEAEQDKAAGSVRDKLVKGAELSGTITRLESFGAFVDLGAGIEGLIHVSEISHQRVGHPQDVLQSGQEIKVQVLRTKDLGKRRKERISLSIKALEKDPWQEIKSQFPVGTVVEGKVDGMEDFGAFVELAEGVRGLVHVSEIADRRIGHPREVLSLEEQVKVVVLDVDVRRQRLRLSIRQVDALESAANLREFRERQQKEQEEAQSNNAMLDALKRANLID